MVIPVVPFPEILLRQLLLGLVLTLCMPAIATLAAEPSPIDIGVARVDITPAYPVRLTGYAARTNLSDPNPAQRLSAKALALGSDAEHPRLLITVDNCGVPANVVEEVAGRLALKHRIRRQDFVVASSHTHCGPMIRGFAENIFVHDLSPEEAAAGDRYTREITDQLESVAVAALHDRHPGRLFRAVGNVGFAANRRTPGGPVDHALPVLWVRGLNGELRATVANYACHCTTLGSQINQCHGDWAGYAQAAIEAEHPGAIALITIGCGADANPNPRGGGDFGLRFARLHGEELAAEVGRLISGPGQALNGLPATAERRFSLPFQTLPTREEWEKRAKEPGIVGYHARKNLARLDRGETLPTGIPYFVQTWLFGDRFAMVFLAGEVVVDYDRRLKAEFDPDRLWITSYANDVPCYIPSRRILAEGGYEAETSLWYYDRPARLSPEIEDLIYDAVTHLLPANLRLKAPDAAALQR